MSGCVLGKDRYSICTIAVRLDANSRGTMVVSGKNPGDRQATVLLTANVVGGPTTPAGEFTASYWERDHVSKKYGSLADTPYSKTLLGGNAFGPYQLHMSQLERRGIYIHGTMGPTWNPSTALNAAISPTSHGCIRMANTDNIQLRELMADPKGNKVVITRTPGGK